jgi:hypothetical protein
MAPETSLPPSPNLRTPTRFTVNPVSWSIPVPKWQLRVKYRCNSVIGAKEDEAKPLNLKLNARNITVSFAMFGIDIPVVRFQY